MSEPQIESGMILEGPFCSEKVRVIASKKLGSSYEVQATGLKTSQFYSRVLSQEDLNLVKQASVLERDFTLMLRSSWLRRQLG